MDNKATKKNKHSEEGKGKLVEKQTRKTKKRKKRRKESQTKGGKKQKTAHTQILLNEVRLKSLDNLCGDDEGDGNELGEDDKPREETEEGIQCDVAVEEQIKHIVMARGPYSREDG